MNEQVNVKMKAKVMIIDDVRVNLKILASLIEGMGYEAITFLEAKEAMDSLPEIMPQLLLLDVMMPEIDGYEFCRIVKKNPKTKDIPVIFISALDAATDKEKGFQAGAVDYIAQPFERSEVAARVGIHIRMYEMSRELESYNTRLNKLVIEQNLKIEEEKKNLLYALAKITESRDNLTIHHVSNVQYNCRLLAQSLQFSPKFENQITNSFIETIEIASALHDIGKIFVQDNVLLKPSKLNDEEMETIKTHASAGANLLRKISKETKENEFIKMAIDIAESHHENWNGSGYPNGLSQLDIPLSARLVHVVDVYDALTSDRCYKKAYSEDLSLKIMEDEAGKSFDPDIIMIFQKINKQLKIG